MVFFLFLSLFSHYGFFLFMSYTFSFYFRYLFYYNEMKFSAGFAWISFCLACILIMQWLIYWWYAEQQTGAPFRKHDFTGSVFFFLAPPPKCILGNRHTIKLNLKYNFLLHLYLYFILNAGNFYHSRQVQYSGKFTEIENAKIQ